MVRFACKVILIVNWTDKAEICRDSWRFPIIKGKGFLLANKHYVALICKYSYCSDNVYGWFGLEMIRKKYFSC